MRRSSNEKLSHGTNLHEESTTRTNLLLFLCIKNEIECNDYQRIESVLNYERML